jgi:uncharacterized damage-inducible protein DinB
MSTMTQTSRLADQIRRAFAGEAWHGDSLLEILDGVRAQQAAAKPIPNAHSIWELLLHIAAWDDAVMRRARGEVVQLSDAENFPPVHETTEAAWKAAIEHAKQKHQELIDAVTSFPEARLGDPVQGKTDLPYYDFYYMISGIAQHELYHAGQIALLKKAQLT